MKKWRSITSGALSGPENMAYDQALLEGVQGGGVPVLRLYRWTPACLSLGRNQIVPRRGEVEGAVRARGFDLVRRPTGGGAVLHEHELTYAVAVPIGLLGSPRETYRAINQALVAGLRKLGVPAIVVEDARRDHERQTDERRGHGVGESAHGMGHPGSSGGRERPNRRGSADTLWEAPCFQAPARGEVVVDGLKLIGSAQRREGRVLLQHGSLLLAGDQGVVAECLAGRMDLEDEPHPASASGFTTLSALLDPIPSRAELITTLTAGFESALGIDFEPDDLSASEAARIEPLTCHFQSRSWTWRR